MIDVREFGATDGADSTDAIQAAVNAGQRRTVVVPAGTYLVRANAGSGDDFWAHTGDVGGIKLPSHTHLVLMAGAVLKAIPHASHGGQVLRIINASNVTIEGPGCIEGDRVHHDYLTHQIRPTHEWNHGIVVRGGRAVRIDGVGIRDCAGDGILIGAESPDDWDTELVWVTRCDIRRSRRNNIAIIDRASGITVTDNCIADAGVNADSVEGTPPRAGIDIESGGVGVGVVPTRVVVSRNILYGNLGAAIINFNGSDVIISDNVADNTISWGYGERTVVRGNVVTEGPHLASPPDWSESTIYPKGARVWFSGSAYLSTVSANVGQIPSGSGWMPAPSRGIDGLGLLSGSTSNTNIVSDNVVSGFEVGVSVPHSSSVTVAGNTITECRSRGVDCFGAENLLVRGNTVAAPVGVRIAFGQDVTIVDNDLTVGTGVEVVQSSAELRDNWVRSFNGFGVRAQNSTTVVRGNTLYPAQGHTAPVLSLESGSSVVRRNFVSGANHGPVLLGSSCSALTVDDNRVVGCTTNGAAVQLADVGVVEVCRNEIVYSRTAPGGYGIHVSGATSGARIVDNTIRSVAVNGVTSPLTQAVGTHLAAGSATILGNRSPGPINSHPTDTVQA